MEIHKSRFTGERKFSLAKQAELTSADVAGFSFPETSASNVVLVDGLLRADFSQTKNLDGIVVVDLFDALADARYSKLVRNYLARNANYHDNGLTALTRHSAVGSFV